MLKLLLGVFLLLIVKCKGETTAKGRTVKCKELKLAKLNYKTVSYTQPLQNSQIKKGLQNKSQIHVGGSIQLVAKISEESKMVLQSIQSDKNLPKDLKGDVPYQPYIKSPRLEKIHLKKISRCAVNYILICKEKRQNSKFKKI